MKKILLSIFAKLFSITNIRYVNRFIPVREKYSQGRTEINTPQEQEALENLKSGIENFKKMLGKYPVLKELSETLYLVIKDLDDFKFTVDIKDGDAEVTVGWDLEKTPSFVLPLYAKNLENVKDVTVDGVIDLNDAYRFIRVLFIPFLKGLYQGDYPHLPKDKSYLKLDNFIHVEVFNEAGIEVDGFPGPAQATVVNVDGQWLVFEGFQGDPDIKFSMNLKQALEFAYLIRIKLIQAPPSTNWIALKPVTDRYNKLKEEVTVYERDWHNI